MRVVLDTNILISGIFFNGKERKVLELWFNGRFEAICTEEIFEEYSCVILRFTEKAQKNKYNEIISIIAGNCAFIDNIFDKKLSRDHNDDKFINCALSGKAHYIISGDKDLLVLEKIADIEIITASYLLNLFT